MKFFRILWSLVTTGEYEGSGWYIKLLDGQGLDGQGPKRVEGYDLVNLAAMIESDGFISISESIDSEVFVMASRQDGQLSISAHAADQSSFEKRFAGLLPHLSCELSWPFIGSVGHEYEIRSGAPQGLEIEDLDAIVGVVSADRSKLVISEW